MDQFIRVHAGAVIGTFETFDRMIFKGTSDGLCGDAAFVQLKVSGAFVKQATEGTKAHVQRVAETAGRRHAIISRVSRGPSIGAWRAPVPSLVLFAWLLACALFAFFPTLSLSYAFDDLDELQMVAGYRAGRQDLLTALRAPHNDHTMPVIRGAFLVSTRAFGLDPLPLRLALCILHALGALACALLARERAGPTAGWLAGTLFASAAAVAGSPIYYPAAANFLFMALGPALGLWALVGQSRRPRAGSAAAVGLLVVACGAGAGATLLGLTLIAASVLPPQDRPRRPWIAAVLVGLSILILVFARENYAQFSGRTLPQPHLQRDGLLAGGFLIWSAPARFLWPLLRFDAAKLSHVLACSSAAWVFGGAASLWLPPASRRLLAAAWLGPCAFAAVVGVGRHAESSWLGLLNTDRYYYPFLLPLALHTALLAAEAWRRSRFRPAIAVLAAAVALFGVYANRSGLRLTVPWKEYAWHAKAIALARDLARRIETRSALATNPPLQLAGGWLPLAGMHHDGLDLEVPYLCEYADGARRVAFLPQVGPAEARVQNALLNGWAAANGLSGPPICVSEGRLGRSTRVADFRVDGYGDAVLAGFNTWEGWFRWMQGEGRLRLTAAPGDLVVRCWTAIDRLHALPIGRADVRLTVALEGRPIGSFTVAGSGVAEVRLPVSEAILPAQRRGTPIEVALKAEPVWRPIDVMPGSGDTRTLSAAIVAIGFVEQGGLEEPVRAARCSE